MKLKDQYTEELYQQFGYYPAWLPGSKFELGDVGVLEGSQFTRISTLDELGISFQMRTDTSKLNMEYVSKNGVSISTRTKGTIGDLAAEAQGNNEMSFVVDFVRGNAVLFQLDGVTITSVRDAIVLGKEVLKRYSNGNWEKEWVVITELVRAERATILVSNSAEGRLELNASFGQKHAPSNLAQLGTQFSVVSQRDLEVKMISEKSTSPLFKLMGIKGLFRSNFGTKSMLDGEGLDSTMPENDYVFEEMNPFSSG